MPLQPHIVDTLITGLFDYAGMFPPANLSLEEAVKEALSFNKTLKRPFLVRTEGVFNATDIGSVAGQLQRLSSADRETFKVTILLDAGDELSTKVKEVCQVLKASHQLQLAAVELKLSSKEHFDQVTELNKTFPCVQIYLEPVKEIREEAIRFAEKEKLGIKVRAAGPTAVKTHELAALICKLASEKIPLKVTQGLHAPFISGDAPTGFLSLALAVYFARVGANSNQIEEILRISGLNELGNTNEEQRLLFKDLELHIDKINDLNEEQILCIGSCSIREPDDYLKKLLPS